LDGEVKKQKGKKEEKTPNKMAEKKKIETVCPKAPPIEAIVIFPIERRAIKAAKEELEQ
jgi:hypothetical protein